jgi:hypothetical protein
MNISDDAERLAGRDASDKSMEQLTLRTKIGGTLDLLTSSLTGACQEN